MNEVIKLTRGHWDFNEVPWECSYQMWLCIGLCINRLEVTKTIYLNDMKVTHEVWGGVVFYICKLWDQTTSTSFQPQKMYVMTVNKCGKQIEFGRNQCKSI